MDLGLSAMLANVGGAVWISTFAPLTGRFGMD